MNDCFYITYSFSSFLQSLIFISTYIFFFLHFFSSYSVPLKGEQMAVGTQMLTGADSPCYSVVDSNHRIIESQNILTWNKPTSLISRSTQNHPKIKLYFWKHCPNSSGTLPLSLPFSGLNRPSDFSPSSYFFPSTFFIIVTVLLQMLCNSFYVFFILWHSKLHTIHEMRPRQHRAQWNNPFLNWLKMLLLMQQRCNSSPFWMPGHTVDSCSAFC